MGQRLPIVRLTIRARIGLGFLTAVLFATVLTFVGGQTADRLPPAGGADEAAWYLVARASLAVPDVTR